MSFFLSFGPDVIIGELAFEERESSRVPDILGEIVPDVGGRSVEKCNKKKIS